MKKTIYSLLILALFATETCIARTSAQESSIKSVREFSQACDLAVGHREYWENKWPYYDVRFPSREDDYTKACDESVEAGFKGKIEEITKERDLLIQQGEALVSASEHEKNVIVPAKRSEGQALIKNAAAEKKDGEELIREGNAIKARGDRAFDSGRVDEAKPFINEGKRRIELGEKKIQKSAEMIEEGEALVKEAENLLASAPTTEGAGKKKIELGKKKGEELLPIEEKMTLFKRASRLFR